MLCYSCLEKRGDCIKKFINWQLFNNDELVINNQNVACEFENNILRYEEDDNTNIIDLNNNIYIRDNKKFTFKVDFNNKCFDYILKENNTKLSSVPIEASIEKEEDIILIYSLDEEKKKIIIQLL